MIIYGMMVGTVGCWVFLMADNIDIVARQMSRRCSNGTAASVLAHLPSIGYRVRLWLYMYDLRWEVTWLCHVTAQWPASD